MTNKNQTSSVAPGVTQNVIKVLFVFGATTPQGAMASAFKRFLDYTQRRNTFCRTPPDE